MRTPLKLSDKQVRQIASKVVEDVTALELVTTKPSRTVQSRGTKNGLYRRANGHTLGGKVTIKAQGAEVKSTPGKQLHGRAATLAKMRTAGVQHETISTADALSIFRTAFSKIMAG